ncbi:MAG: glycosyltransferase family 39 protein [Anaerolineales bacterium]|jgi:hypothetical protein|nr:glycosyltransferase family 39 protein [Anaerolineales bacterium]
MNRKSKKPIHWVKLFSNHRVYLAIILLAALGIRLWGIDFGLPFAYHYDEMFYLTGGLNTGAGVFGTANNPPGFMNILTGEYGLFYILGRALHLFGSARDFESYYRADPSIFYLLSRITSAVFGSLTVLVAYLIGKQSLGKTVGLSAAVYLAFSFLHVRDSHFGVPDIAATFFVALAVSLVLWSLGTKSWRRLLLAAAAAGLAATIKWSVWPVIVPVALGTYALSTTGVVRRRVARFVGLGSLAGFVFMLSFAILGFQLVLAPKAYFEYAKLEYSAGGQGGFALWQVDTVPGWLFYLKTLTYGIGWILLGLALLGLGWLLAKGLRSRSMTVGILLSFPLVYFLVMGSTRHYFARYALPMIPFLVVCAAAGLDWLMKGLFKQGTGTVRAAWYGLTLLLIIQPGLYSVRFDQLVSREDTRTQAKTWIEANLPAGAKIAMDDRTLGPPLSTEELPVAYSKKNYQVSIPNFRGLYPGAPPVYFREQGYDYLIASSFIYEIPVIEAEMQQRRQAFYQALEVEYPLIQEIWPRRDQIDLPFIFDEIYGPVVSLWERERPGPVIKIYAVGEGSQP